MILLVAKFFAAVLVALTALPFTAPFAAFDITHQSGRSSSSVDDGSHALPLLIASNRTRTRLVSEFDTNTAADYRTSPALYICGAAFTSSAAKPGACPSVLRI